MQLGWQVFRGNYMTKSPLHFSIVDSIGHLVLSNPPKNEMDLVFFRTLTHIRKTIFPGLQIKGIIIYGKERHFSSGANIRELISSYQSSYDRTLESFLKTNHETFLSLESLPYPTVAVINGCCLGAGLELALTCNYRLASPHAVFSLPESTFGIMPGCGGTIRLRNNCTIGKTIETILTGNVISCDEACQMGLVDAIVIKKDIVTKAIELIENLNSLQTAHYFSC